MSLYKNLSSTLLLESNASQQAKKMGLDYQRFGRYGKNGVTTHKSVDGGRKLVPVKQPTKPKSPKFDKHQTAQYQRQLKKSLQSKSKTVEPFDEIVYRQWRTIHTIGKGKFLPKLKLDKADPAVRFRAIMLLDGWNDFVYARTEKQRVQHLKKLIDNQFISGISSNGRKIYLNEEHVGLPRKLLAGRDGNEMCAEAVKLIKKYQLSGISKPTDLQLSDFAGKCYEAGIAHYLMPNDINSKKYFKDRYNKYLSAGADPKQLSIQTKTAKDTAELIQKSIPPNAKIQRVINTGQIINPKDREQLGLNPDQKKDPTDILVVYSDPNNQLHTQKISAKMVSDLKRITIKNLGMGNLGNSFLSGFLNPKIATALDKEYIKLREQFNWKNVSESVAARRKGQFTVQYLGKLTKALNTLNETQRAELWSYIHGNNDIWTAVANKQTGESRLDSPKINIPVPPIKFDFDGIKIQVIGSDGSHHKLTFNVKIESNGHVHLMIRHLYPSNVKESLDEGRPPKDPKARADWSDDHAWKKTHGASFSSTADYDPAKDKGSKDIGDPNRPSTADQKVGTYVQISPTSYRYRVAEDGTPSDWRYFSSKDGVEAFDDYFHGQANKEPEEDETDVQAVEKDPSFDQKKQLSDKIVQTVPTEKLTDQQRQVLQDVHGQKVISRLQYTEAEHQQQKLKLQQDTQKAKSVRDYLRVHPNEKAELFGRQVDYEGARKMLEAIQNSGSAKGTLSSLAGEAATVYALQTMLSGGNVDELLPMFSKITKQEGAYLTEDWVRTAMITAKGIADQIGLNNIAQIGWDTDEGRHLVGVKMPKDYTSGDIFIRTKNNEILSVSLKAGDEMFMASRGLLTEVPRITQQMERDGLDPEKIAKFEDLVGPRRYDEDKQEVVGDVLQRIQRNPALASYMMQIIRDIPTGKVPDKYKIRRYINPAQLDKVLRGVVKPTNEDIRVIHNVLKYASVHGSEQSDASKCLAGLSAIPVRATKRIFEAINDPEIADGVKGFIMKGMSFYSILGIPDKETNINRQINIYGTKNGATALTPKTMRTIFGTDIPNWDKLVDAARNGNQDAKMQLGREMKARLVVDYPDGAKTGVIKFKRKNPSPPPDMYNYTLFDLWVRSKDASSNGTMALKQKRAFTQIMRFGVDPKQWPEEQRVRMAQDSAEDIIRRLAALGPKSIQYAEARKELDGYLKYAQQRLSPVVFKKWFDNIEVDEGDDDDE